MDKQNSPIKLDLPSAPITQKADIFNELITTYSALRTLQAAMTTYFSDDNIIDPVYNKDASLTKYIIGNGAKLLIKAGAAITRGRFLELYTSSGELRVRHTRFKSTGQSWNSIGLSLDDVEVGKTVTVYTYPAIIPGFSDLELRPYYFYDDGQFIISNTPYYPDAFPAVGSSRMCGFGISSTQMQLMGFMAS